MASPTSPASSATLSCHSDEELPLAPYSLAAPSADFYNDDLVFRPEDWLEPLSASARLTSIQAAGDPNPLALKAVLGRDLGDCLQSENYHRPRKNPRYWDCGPNSSSFSSGEEGITSPLLEAVSAKLPYNVDILLKAGADPNGVDVGIMEKYAAFFLRFRPRIPPLVEENGDVAFRKELLECMNQPQMSNLTQEEIEDRMWDGMAPFWSEEGFTPVNFFPHGDSMPSLVEAAKSGSIPIFKRLLEAGADASFWTRPQFFVPNLPTVSSLSLSSPLHAAIRGSQPEMLRYLLSTGFDPNTQPLINPTRCFTPLMATIIYSRTFNKEAFDILASHPSINFEIRTPVYGVHILHFAAATLNLELLKVLSARTSLKNAGTTSLGHTLLHIACLPADSTHVQRHSKTIYQSIHETRDLSPMNDADAPYPILEAGWADPGNSEKWYVDFGAQTEVVKYLYENGITNLESTDVHGNTALHYLCGCKIINWELLDWLRQQENGEDIFQYAPNIYNSWPEELFVEGSELYYAALEAKGVANRENWFPAECMERDLEGPQEWFDREYTKDRVRMKEQIWKKLLDG